MSDLLADSMIIDLMQEKDVEAVWQISQSSPFVSRWTRRMFEQEFHIPISRFLVVRHSHTVIGYGGYWKMGQQAHIVHLAVDPQWRRQGVGSVILHELLRRAKEEQLSCACLEVHADNEEALRLYAKLGFAGVGVRRQYYGAQGDAVLLEKGL